MEMHHLRDETAAHHADAQPGGSGTFHQRRHSHPDRAKSSVRDSRMKRARLALIGAGRMGSTHARALAAGCDAVEVAALVEPSDEAAGRVAIAPRYRNVAELIAAGGVDGAIVAAPTRAHVAVVTELLDAGIPVLCEKPCGLRSDETRTL